MRCGLRVSIIAFRYTSVGVSENKKNNNNNNNSNKINVRSTMIIIASYGDRGNYVTRADTGTPHER